MMFHFSEVTCFRFYSLLRLWRIHHRRNRGKAIAYNYFTNGKGDVVYVQDKENKLYNYYAYDAFGNRIEVLETLYNPMTYRGYYYDEESEDYYLRARYYNPELGRFITEDSFRGNYQDPLSLNLYTYAHNSPLYYNDPSGHAPWVIPAIKGVGWIIGALGLGGTALAIEEIEKIPTHSSSRFDDDQFGKPTTTPREEPKSEIKISPKQDKVIKDYIFETPVQDGGGIKDKIIQDPVKSKEKPYIYETPRRDPNMSTLDYYHLTLIQGNSSGNNNSSTDKLENTTSWERMTAKESQAAAKKLGFEKTNYRAKNGEPIYYNKKTKTYISQDVGSTDGSGPHNGGVWKQAKSPQAINSKNTRMGTYDGKLNKVGD